MKKNNVKPDIKMYDIEKYPMLICTSPGAVVLKLIMAASTTVTAQEKVALVQ